MSYAATSIFNLPDYRVISAGALADGRRRVRDGGSVRGLVVDGPRRVE